REALADGREGRGLPRKGGDRPAAGGCDGEVAGGDLLDAASLKAAATGVTRVFHVAADYRLWARDAGELYRANVDGTRQLLQAAVDAGAERIVYTSTAGALGIPKARPPGDEASPVSPAA